MITLTFDDSTVTLIITGMSMLSTALGVMFGRTHVAKATVESKLSAVNAAADVLIQASADVVEGKPLTPEQVKTAAAAIQKILGRS